MPAAKTSNTQPNQIVVFGQRGVGKTSFIQRLKTYWNTTDYIFLDLDQEIEKHLEKTISEIFQLEGEVQFRKYEIDIFHKLLLRHPRLVLTVGGGFPVQHIPKDVHALWLQRLSDETGRIFIDRPRLNPEISDLEEFFQRAKVREIEFEKRNDEIYFMPEGIRSENKFEELMFQEQIKLKDSCFITLDNTFIDKINFLNKVKESGFEYRDDLLDFAKFKEFYQQIKPTKMILSFRDKAKIHETKKAFISFLKTTTTDIDWALELGSSEQLNDLQPTIISLHDYLENENLSSFLQRLEKSSVNKAHLKAAPVITEFAELTELWHWQQLDPENRSILPRSKEGHWCWFRQFMKGRQKINFWKIAKGSAPDQPTLYQWLSTPSICKKFAAVLGFPVKHSRTPIEQQHFFAQRNMAVFAIDLKDEYFSEGLAFLKPLGLCAAAVTSPLKIKAFELVNSNHEGAAKLAPRDAELASINTLYFSSQKSVFGTNTDFAGFKAMSEEFANKNFSVLVWGGGGTLTVIKEVFKQAVEYSVRSGQARKADSELTHPDIVIWAASPNSEAPKLKANPKFVLDLNYKEDSLARSYAKAINAKYISGEKMFIVQAEKQQEFWSSFPDLK